MFDLSNLTNNLEGQSLSNVIVIALVSFVLSSLIALTYQRTSREIESPKYFIQSLILISIPVATVMQAIGDSLARGLGMLGALAIIRFRTTLRNPRNMVFMFTSIAVGIATGVYGIPIALVGTIAFCSIVFLIHFSPISKTNHVIGSLQFEIPNIILDTEDTRQKMEELLKDNCARFSLTKYSVNGKGKNEKGIKTIVFAFKIKVIHKERARDIVNELSNMKGVYNVRINFRDDNEKI
ncbi:MAG: putative membrane protein YhiD involved in acid resistance [Patiriisocius sp.]|jgi:uncharacterized membrane protein YhiD involved in acid resistance